MTRPPGVALLVAAALACAGAAPARLSSAQRAARIVDAVSRAPIPRAIVTIRGVERRSDERGRVLLESDVPDSILVRAQGYLRTSAPAGAAGQPEPDIALQPFRPKALYLSVYGIGDKTLRTAALAVIDATEANALVIDVKGDRGMVPYRSAVALAADIGAQRVITIADLPRLVTDLRSRGIYTIARIVVFKDTLLASARPALALHKQDGSIFRDRERLAWANPYSREVWSYNIGIALEAARAGFDEIQFDYVRLPDAIGLAYDLPWTEANRAAAISGFLTEARRALAPTNVFLAADVFGYICWNRDDTKIGQKLEQLAGIVDYLSPMLYPSGFQFGIPGYRNPIQFPYQIVRLSLEQAAHRTGLPLVHFRPWLQAFRDYAFGGRAFAAAEIRAQIRAAEDSGADGWMFWNPRNQYSAADFKP